MSALLRVLPLLALLFGAIESVLVRLDLPQRPTEPRLFLQAALLWLCFGVLALLPARATLALLARRRRRAGGGEGRERRAFLGPATVLGLWMAAPVLVHNVLDEYVGLAGNLSHLAAPLPWLAVAVVLALELAVALSLGWVGARLDRRLAMLALGAASLGAGLFLPWHGASLAAAPPGGEASAAGRPNVLLLVWDTTRADHTSPYHYARDTTPHLAELAEQSTVYDQARSVSCFTFSSHVSMLTGLLPSSHGSRLTFMRFRPDRAAHVARLFRAAGYRTGGFVGTDVLAGRTGIDTGFDVYDDQVDPPVCDTQAWSLVHDVQALLASRVRFLRNNGLPHWIQDFQRGGDEVLAHALAWIRRDDPRPWFCLINLYDAHWPYLPERDGLERFVHPYDGPLDGYLFRSNRWKPGYAMQPADVAHVNDLYDAELYDLDEAVDRFLGALELDRGGTAVLMTGDHGEALGEGGEWKHEDILEPQVHVPFLVRPGTPAPEGRRVEGYVSGADVAPTLLGLAGLGSHVAELHPDGMDLTAADPGPDRMVRVEDRDHMDRLRVNVALYSGPWKLVRRGLGDAARFALFDLRSDPVGLEDVSEQNPKVFESLVARAKELWAKADAEDESAPPPGEGTLLDALSGLGYTNR